MTPFEASLGARFHHLQPQIRQLHGGRAPQWAGEVTVVRAAGLAARAISAISGFPGSMENAAFSICVAQTETGERWTRNFGSKQTVSDLCYTSSGVLEERFGVICLSLDAQVRSDALSVGVRNARIFATLTLPGFLTPKSDARIWQDEAGRYRFDIKATFPVFGEVLRYHGWLRPAVASAFVQH